jgi:hypothetical protein
VSQFDFLMDENEGILCYLINCKVLSSEIACGGAYFRGGISGDLKLVDVNLKAIATIVIPPEIRNIGTFLFLASKEDDIKIKIST